MAEERCGPCKDAGQPNVLAAYKGTTAGQSGSGRAKPPMCYAHRNNLKPTWMSQEDWDKTQVASPLRKHDVPTSTQVGKRVEEALQTAGLSTTPEGAQEVNDSRLARPHPKFGIEVRQPNAPADEDAPRRAQLTVPCMRQVSPQCERTVPAEKNRKICSECWSYLHQNSGPKKKKVVVAEMGTQAPITLPEAGPLAFQLDDHQLYGLLCEVWASVDEQIMASVIKNKFVDLPRAVQVDLVQTALRERRSRSEKPDSPAGMLPDWLRVTKYDTFTNVEPGDEVQIRVVKKDAGDRPVEVQVGKTEEEIEEMRKGYASMH